MGCTEGKNNDTMVEESHRDPAFEALAQAIETDLQTAGNPNAVFAVFQDGEILYVEGWGETEDGNTIDQDTRFRIGSVADSMTAATAFVIDTPMNTPVVDMVSGIDLFKSPDRIQEITMQHLLEHSGGLVDSVGQGNDDSLASFMETTFYDEMFIIAPPGRFWNASNLNYVVASYVLEQYLGVPYGEGIESSLLSPLGMSRTTFDSEDISAEGNWARGMDLGSEVPLETDNSYLAGFSWSTAADLVTFGDVILSGETEILSNEQHSALVSPQISMGLIEDKLQSGNGLIHYEGISSNAGWHDIDIIFQNGSIPGYGAAIYLLPEHNAGFISLVGATGVQLPSAVISAIQYFGLPEAGDFPSEALALQDLSLYEGTYIDDWNVGEIHLTANVLWLEVEMPRLDEMGVIYDSKWRPYTKHNFQTKIDGYDILLRFEMDSQGRPEFIVHRAFVGNRVE